MPPSDIGEALTAATRRLRDAASPTPRLDAEVLLAHALGVERSWLLAHPEAPMRAADQFADLVARRASGEPVAYLRGFKEWHGLRIRTDARALIPRPETELLADAAADEVERRLHAGPVVAWDIGTGSGAVAIVLALRAGGRATILASDISADALALAATNVADHGAAVHVELFVADLLEGAGSERPRPDVVVANLPYVASGEVDERRGSLGFEPRTALDGGSDGLEVLARLMVTLPGAVAPGAAVFLEIGVDQAAAIERLAPPDASVAVVPDLAGVERVVRLSL